MLCARLTAARENRGTTKNDCFPRLCLNKPRCSARTLAVWVEANGVAVRRITSGCDIRPMIEACIDSGQCEMDRSDPENALSGLVWSTFMRTRKRSWECSEQRFVRSPQLNVCSCWRLAGCPERRRLYTAIPNVLTRSSGCQNHCKRGIDSCSYQQEARRILVQA